RPMFFATAMPLAGYATGLLVESHEGRPTKVEGNPDHPACPKPSDTPAAARFGPSDLFAQASVLTLYDPDRSQSVSHVGMPSTWEAFVVALRVALRDRPRVRILTETVTSPSLLHQLRTALQRFPNARWHHYEPAGSDNARNAAWHAFGEHVATHYRLDRADVILALDADFLSCGPNHLRHLRDFSDRRRPRSAATPLRP